VANWVERRIQGVEQILPLLPATYKELARQLRVERQIIEYWINKMRRDKQAYIGKWLRSDRQGSFKPVFYPGKGRDKPCRLKPLPLRKRTKHINYKARRREAQRPKVKATPFDALFT
jgi:hypothetical protein